MRITLILLAAVPLLAQTPAPEKVKDTVRKAKDALLRQQGESGLFGRDVGTTLLATLALVRAGVPAQDPAIKRALAASMTPLHRTYRAAVRLMLIEEVRVRAFMGLARSDLEMLLSAQHQTGGWGYHVNSRQDNSLTQYALLGLRAAEELGFKVPRDVWIRALAYLVRQPLQDGSAGYKRKASEGTGSMTAGLLSSLVIARARCGPQAGRDLMSQSDVAVAGATEWLRRNWRPVTHRWMYYELYGLERAMAFSRMPSSDWDWWSVGASWLLKNAGGKKTWGAETSDPRNTAFALLFLVRKTRAQDTERGATVLDVLSSLGAQSRTQDVIAVVTLVERMRPEVCEELVLHLRAPERRVRQAAAMALRRKTGLDLGFDHEHDAEDNTVAIEAWRRAIFKDRVHLKKAESRRKRPGSGRPGR